MKEYYEEQGKLLPIEKTDENLKKCWICGKTFTTVRGRTRHVLDIHKIYHKVYYDKFFKLCCEGRCKVCGNETTFFYGKYLEYCGYKCSNNSIDDNLKRSESIKKSWSGKNEIDIINRYNKHKKTLLNKYGSDNNFKIPEILEKTQKTNLKRYGNIHAFKNKEIQKKQRLTIIDRYGVENISKLESVKNKVKHKSRIRTYNNLFRFSYICTPLFTVDQYIGQHWTIKYKWLCSICNKEFESEYDDGIIPTCTHCFPHTRSITQNEIFDYIKTFNTNIICNSRKIIPPQELDIYIPDKKIAFEYNGLFWHSETNEILKKYHLNKTKKCEDVGIRLIHIFEDEWVNKKQIVKNRIKNLLKYIKRKIFARKCIIKEISPQLKNKFLNKYHIQGEDKSCVYLGLFYKNRLVSVMTFSKLRKALGQTHKEGYYELSRFCSVNNFNIIGGASKLLSYFEKLYNPSQITTYADRRWSQGNLYYKLGFKLDHMSPPNYWYTKGQERTHRYNFRKNILKNKIKHFDPLLTEHENMRKNGFHRIWDCGNLVFKKEYKHENK